MDAPVQHTAVSAATTAAWSGAAVVRSPLGLRRIAWWAAGVLIAVAAAFGALYQHSRTDPLRASQRWTERGWWLEPFQRNAIFSLANVGGMITDVSALPGGQHIWALISGTMLVHSENGGRGWRAVPFRKNDRDSVGSIFFLDRNTGWIAGPGIILHTTDGGKTWERHERSDSLALFQLQFVTASRGWGLNSRSVYETQDGGRTWRDLGIKLNISGAEPERVLRFRMLTNGSGWCLLESGTIAETRNFGATWTPLPAVPETMQPATSVSGALGAVITNMTDIMAPLLKGYDVPNAQQAAPNRSAVNLKNPNSAPIPQQQQQAVPGKNAPPPAARLTWAREVRAIDSDADGVTVVLWLRDGRALVSALTRARAWEIRPRAFPGKFEIAQVIPVGAGAVLATTEPELLMRIEGATSHMLLCGVGPALALDVAREPSGRPVWWMAGHGGTVLRSRDAGETWEARAAPATTTLIALDFIDGLTGFAGTTAGEIYRTTDGARTWTKTQLPKDDEIVALHTVDANIALAAIDRSVIYHTSDGGKSWMERAPLAAASTTLHFGAFAPDIPGSVLVASDESKTFRFHVADARWEDGPIVLPELPVLYGRYHYLRTFASGEALAHGAFGPVLARRDGNSDFAARGTQAFISVAFEDDGRHGLGLTREGTVLRTENAGGKWTPANAPALIVPAPWYWGSWLMVGLCFWRALRRDGQNNIRVVTSIAGKATPDAPIGPNDRDVLGLGDVARGLSRFFRNRATVGPFTVAVAGEWGSGKTSFMRLLREDLEENEVRPVWFNAWHQQHEENYLPALLETIVSQAVPPIWNSSGWGFRLRLIGARIWRARVKIFWLVAFAMFFGSLLSRDDADQVMADVTAVASRAWTQVSQVFVKNDEGPKPDAPAGGADAVKTTILLGGATTSLLALLHTLWSSFKAFGVEPAQLLAKAASSRNKDVEARMSFQRRFARDFSEVTNALGAVPLVIFIDDLDRCKPEKTVEMLEAINFLVASGGCFVVIGLAKAQVEACVGLGYREISGELAAHTGDAEPPGRVREAEESSGPDERLAAAERRKFARNYLEKLINLEIAIPPPTTTQRAELLSGRDRNSAKPPQRSLTGWRRRAHALLVEPQPQLKRGLFSAALCASVLTLAWTGGQIIRPPHMNPAAAATIPAGAITERAPAPDATANAPTLDRVARPAETRSENITAALDSSDILPALHNPGVGGSDVSLVAIAMVMAFLSLAGLVAQRGETLTEDSPKFVNALEDWSPVIESSHATPRALKRFVNRVRYFAMQQTHDAPPQSLHERFAGWVATKVCKLPLPVRETDEAGIPEDFLVALAAIDAFGAAHQVAPFGSENVNAAVDLAQGTYRAAAGAPTFSQVYPLSLVMRHRLAYQQLAAGAKPNI